MVTKRDPGSFASLQKNKSLEYFDKFGRSDFTLTSVTKTTDVQGKITAISESTSTIVGDFQWVTVKEKQFIDLGLAVVGDGIFYTTPDVTINENDKITVDSVVWILTSQIEGEQTDGETIYQGWIAKRESP